MRLAAHQVRAATLALLTKLYYGAQMSLPTNDDFMHMWVARQLLAGPSAAAALAGVTLPSVVDFVRRSCDVAGTLDVDGDRYVVLAQRGRSIVRRYGSGGWPCYTTP